MLFSDDTAVIHISGNKENPGHILKTNQGLTKVFGYSKTEVMGHSVNILMPVSFGKRHNDFLEKFFKTGRKTVFNRERILYGLNKNNYCFCMKLLVKQMPTLVEGIQYVGMIRQTHSDYEYILTDTKGVIECFSFGITSLLELPINLFKETEINIQMLAPDLIKLYSPLDKKKNLLSKFQEPGGKRLTMIVPKDFPSHFQTDGKKNTREMGKSISGKGIFLEINHKRNKNINYREINKDLSKRDRINNKQITPQMLLQSPDYRECEIKQTVKCEIIDCSYAEEYKDIDSLKLRIFKLSGMSLKRNGTGMEQSSDLGEYHLDSPSNTSDIRDLKDESIKHEEKQELMNLVINGPGLEPLTLSIKEGENNREETKTTEKIQGNLITTEGRLETLEAKPVLDIKRNLSDQSVKKSKEEKKEEELSEAKRSSEDAKKDEDASTPRVDIGSIKGPEIGLSASHVADQNTMNKNEESLFDSISANSTDRGKNIKDQNDKQNEAKVHFHSSSGRLLEEFHKKKKKIAAGNKPGTMMDEKNCYKAGGKYTTFRDHNLKKKSAGEESKEIIKIKSDIKSFEMKLDIPDMVLHRASEDSRVERSDNEIRSFAERRIQSNEPIKAADEKGNDEKPDAFFSNKEAHRGTSQKTLTQDDGRKSGIVGKKTSRIQKAYKCKIISDERYDSNRMEYPEYKPTEDELRLRRSLLTFIKNKDKKKIEKDKKDEAKKVHEKEDASEDKEEDKNSDEEEEHSDNKDVEEEEVSNGNQNNQGSVASSSAGSAMRSFCSLRLAIDEKYVPFSVRNMSYVANVVLLIILGLSIGYFVLEFVLYARIKRNTTSMVYAEERIKSLLNINLHLVDMMIISADYNQHAENPSLPYNESFVYDDITITPQYLVKLQDKLKQEATLLKNAQTELSVNSNELLSNTLKEVNPDNVTLHYMYVPGMPSTYYYSTWQTVMETVVCSYRVSTTNITNINDTSEATVYFVSTNSLNDVIINLKGAADSIADEIKDRKKYTLMIFTVLLSVASVILFFSTVLLIPVVNKVNKNKQEVLELFMYIRKATANEELNKCKKFVNAFQPNQETEIIAGEGDEGGQEDAEENEGDVTSGKMKQIEKHKNYSVSKRKFKRLVLNLGIVLFKFIFLILIMEGYFVLSYLLSNTFLNHVISLTEELNYLVKRFPVDSFLLLLER